MQCPYWTQDAALGEFRCAAPAAEDVAVLREAIEQIKAVEGPYRERLKRDLKAAHLVIAVLAEKSGTSDDEVLLLMQTAREQNEQEICESCGGKVETDAPYDQEYGIDICLKCRTELRNAENYHPIQI